MIADVRPLVDITREAIQVLYQEIGVVNTVRFLYQFTAGYGNYTEERGQLFGHLTLDEIIAQIKQDRNGLLEWIKTAANNTDEHG